MLRKSNAASTKEASTEREEDMTATIIFMMRSIVLAEKLRQRATLTTGDSVSSSSSGTQSLSFESIAWSRPSSRADASSLCTSNGVFSSALGTLYRFLGVRLTIVLGAPLVPLVP